MDIVPTTVVGHGPVTALAAAIDGGEPAAFDSNDRTTPRIPTANDPIATADGRRAWATRGRASR